MNNNRLNATDYRPCPKIKIKLAELICLASGFLEVENKIK